MTDFISISIDAHVDGEAGQDEHTEIDQDTRSKEDFLHHVLLVLSFVLLIYIMKVKHHLDNQIKILTRFVERLLVIRYVNQGLPFLLLLQFLSIYQIISCAKVQHK